MGQHRERARLNERNILALGSAAGLVTELTGSHHEETIARQLNVHVVDRANAPAPYAVDTAADWCRMPWWSPQCMAQPMKGARER